MTAPPPSPDAAGFEPASAALYAQAFERSDGKGTVYSGFFSFVSSIWVSLNRPPPELVTLTEVPFPPGDEKDIPSAPQGPYWGWVDAGSRRVSMVQYSRLSFLIQSGDYFKHAVKTGQGRIALFRIEPPKPPENQETP